MKKKNSINKIKSEIKLFAETFEIADDPDYHTLDNLELCTYFNLYSVLSEIRSGQISIDDAIAIVDMKIDEVNVKTGLDKILKEEGIE